MEKDHAYRDGRCWIQTFLNQNVMNGVLQTMASALLLLFAVACNKPDEPDVPDEPEHSLDGHDYVDLGLPSGTLWATCNLGASVPEEFGDYYAWGETVTKEIYDWKNYRYGNYLNDISEMTKYCSNPDWGLDGFSDTLTVLEPTDDAALVQWGSGWRMATREEWAELYQNTTCEWTERNGVLGLLMTGSNGNGIFLPAAGYRDGVDMVSKALGIYWSSSLQTAMPMIAWSFHFTLDYWHVCGSYERNRGQVVRAVYSRQ